MSVHDLNPITSTALRLFCAICLLCCAASVQAQIPLKLHITGVHADVRDNIQLRLESAYRALEDSPRFWPRFANSISENVRKALEPYGYFRAKMSIKENAAKQSVNIDITPGPQLHITRLIIRIVGPGMNDEEYLKLLNNFPLNKGEPLRIDNYNEAKKLLFNTAQTRGYLRARLVQNVIKIDKQAYTSTIILYFDTGPRFYFGSVAFSKNPYADEFLMRFVNFRYGDPYSTSELLKLQDAYNSSGFFEQVVVEPDFDTITRRHVPIQVDLIPRKSRRYTFGVGYDGTKNAVRGIVGLDLRRLTNSGHHLQAITQGSIVQSSSSASYIIPGPNPLTDEYAITGAVFHENLNDLETLAAQLGVSYQSQWGEWQRTVGISALLERQYNTSANVATKTTNWLYPSMKLRRIHADDPLNSKNGFLVDFLMRGGSKSLLSDANFLQFRADMKYLTTRPQQTRFILRATAGITVIDDINSLAPSLQFRTGGAQTVRGYTYRSLGPGKYLLVGSAEVQHPIIDDVRAAVFYDAGNAFDAPLKKLEQSVGMGIVWATAVGSVNVGAAWRLARESNRLQLVFSMGPDLS